MISVLRNFAPITDMGPKVLGVVKMWSTEKGFGFIKPYDMPVLA